MSKTSKVKVTTRTRRAVLGGAALVIVAAVALVAIQSGDDPTEAAAGSESDLPTTTFELFDGTETAFANFEGRPLIINFWASWCPACVAELPEFQKVHEEYQDRVTFLGLANADRRDAALSLAGDVGLTYTLGDDPEGELFTDLELIAMPSTIFVDADGRIHEVFAGQLNEPLLVERIDRLLEQS